MCIRDHIFFYGAVTIFYGVVTKFLCAHPLTLSLTLPLGCHVHKDLILVDLGALFVLICILQANLCKGGKARIPVTNTSRTGRTRTDKVIYLFLR